jgi:DNA polymerase-3 subunit epsilon
MWYWPFIVCAFAVVDDSILIGDNFGTYFNTVQILHLHKLSNEFIIESKTSFLVKA